LQVQLRNFSGWMRDGRGQEYVEGISTADLLEYRQSLQHLARSTQNRYLAVTKSFFAWRLDAELIEKKRGYC
jgi:site-specific recombinase XerD